MATFQIKKNNRAPALAVLFLEADGTALNLSTATGVTFTMRHGTAAPKVNAQACVITSAAGGAAEYRWAAGDTDTANVYRGEFTITWTGGSTETHPVDGHVEVVVKDVV